MLRKKCLGCGAAYTLSGSGRRQRYCETCRSTGRRAPALQPFENKGRKARGFNTHTSPDIGEFVRAQILAQKDQPDPITFTLPDGRKGRVWLSTAGVGDARHWQMNIAEAVRLDRLALAKEGKAWPVDVMGGQSNRKIHRRIRHAILAVEHILSDAPKIGPLQGDEDPLTYDENCYPELPACLDQRPKIHLAKAA